MLEVEEIQPEEFHKEQTYGEVIDLLKAIVNGEDNLPKENLEYLTNDLRNVIDILWDKFGISISTKFLKGLLIYDKHRTAIINKYLRIGDIKTKTTNRYFKEFKCIPYRQNVTEYGYNKWNELIVRRDTQISFGKFSVKNDLETIKQIISNEEYREIEERNNRFNKYLNKMEEEIKDIPLTERQMKAISKRQRGEIKIRCKNCGKFVYFHTCPNIENDEKEKFVWNLYNTKMKNMMEGREFCLDCSKKTEKDGMWDIAFIMEFLNELKESRKCVKISAENFCKEFRNDGKKVSVGYIRNVLLENSEGMKVYTEGDFVKIGKL